MRKPSYFSKNRGSRTGRVGVIFVERKLPTRRNGSHATDRYFVARIKRNGRAATREFSINRLGLAEAWKAAVNCRMGWENEVARASAATSTQRHARTLRCERVKHTPVLPDQPRYVYLGDKLTRPELIGARCNPVLNRDRRCVVSKKLGTALVEFVGGLKCVVLRRRLRLCIGKEGN